MPEKRRKKPQTVSGVKTVIAKTLIGSLLGAVMFFVLTALASLILWKTDADESIYKFISLIIGAVSAFTGGFAGVRPVRKNGIAFGALSVLPVYLAEILAGVLVSKGGIGLIGWIMLAVQLLFSAVGGIIAVNKRK